MANLTVAVIGPAGYAKDLGKKGTSTDITFYNLKKGHNTVTIIEPTRYPERLAPLFFSVSLADAAIVVVDELNAAFGECLLMLGAAGITKGYLVLRNYLSPDQVKPLLKGTALEGYAFIEDDAIALREELLGAVEQMDQAPPADGKTCIVPIDHFFNVRGIGTVILGSVAAGRLKKHDSLTIQPIGKTALVRSIQKHDDDVDDAYAGDRVGLALKNVDYEDLDRGYVLTNDPAIASGTAITGRLDLVPFWKAPITEGMVLHIGYWMQYQPSRVLSVEGSTLTIEMEKDLVYLPGTTAVVTYLEGGALRIAGTLTLS
ncbi:EF-Tu/IF-2/RF-3 family GTPase [Methanofollis fontis]|uniref:Elongation factor Tu n=1 Tax=Methanofollis fontis TaxID=2052832 RepID=A0A483CSX4_9EURY|nr:EF-Tu/IF-2/RF-3 family GTPase [Methanofollis fontis]TAJ44301.1 elongation factor Tu [Methanofollis fontis]